MWQIDKSIPEVTHPRGCVRVFLNPDKGLNPYTFAPPIRWSGFIDNETIIIIQNSTSAIFSGDFEFLTFPQRYNHLKGDIIALIDKSLRTMD